MVGNREKQLIFIHGRGRKPGEAILHELWVSALEKGIARDKPDLAEAFGQIPKSLFYYADDLAHLDADAYDLELDVTNRRQALDRLASLTRTRDFRRRYYEELPGKTAFKEFLMDLGASAGFSRAAIARTMPELKHYWTDQEWAQGVRQRFGNVLTGALEQRDVLLISHCLGSVISYDVLYELNRTRGDSPRLSRWLTIGSPLGSNYVQTKLAGADEKNNDRYPSNINDWHNIAAEDDYVCHDKTVADDYAAMMDHRLVGSISDRTIYNLAVRYGRSNPHSSLGYLIHPHTVEYVTSWLGE